VSWPPPNGSLCLWSCCCSCNGLRDLEAFQDSGNPGYFLVKLALWAMAILIIGQSLLDLLRPQAADDA
jgi:hypothetical protein